MTIADRSTRPFVMPHYDKASFDAMRDALLPWPETWDVSTTPSDERTTSTRSGT